MIVHDVLEWHGMQLHIPRPLPIFQYTTQRKWEWPGDISEAKTEEDGCN